MTQAGGVLRRGVIAGLLGAATVAVWFLAFDIAAGRPFRTPAALGSQLLFGGGAPHSGTMAVSGSQGLEITFRVVAAYTAVHIVAFAIAGIVFVLIAEQLERTPSFLLLAALAAIVLEAFALGNLAQGAQWIMGDLGIWSVLVANVLAIAVMGFYVWQTHPTLRRRLTGQPREVRV